MLGVVGVLTVEAQGKGPWWEIPGKVSLHPRRLYDWKLSVIGENIAAPLRLKLGGT